MKDSRRAKKQKVALINSAPMRTGRGNYAYHLLYESRNLGIQADMFCTDPSVAKYFNGAFVLETHTLKSSLVRKVCNRLVLPKKVPNGYDLYHILSEGISYFVKRHSPSIVTCHDTPSYIRGTSTFLEECIRVKANYNPMLRASNVITTTRYLKENLIRNLNIPRKKVSVVHLGVDHKLFRPVDKLIARRYLGLPVNKSIILGLEHNIDLLIRAYGLMRSIRRTYLLILAHPKKRLVKAIQLLNLGSRVKWCFNMPDRKMPLLYCSADILVHPSYYEGFGLPLLEAMSCGTPIITTNYGAMRETVGDSALIIKNPSDHKLLTDTMENLLQNKELQYKLHYNSLQRAEKFSWKKTAVETRGVYARTLKDA